MRGYIPENFKISISKKKSKKLSSQNPSPQPPPELLTPAAEHDQTVDLNLLADNREPIPSGSQALLSPATTQLQIIKNLCSTIKDLEVNSSYYYLGILNDDKLQRKHRVWLPRVNTTTPTPQPTGETTSLQSLLSNSSQSPPSRKDRLQLGVKLASSVMQLHDTAWLDESWGKDDIIFPLAILESVDRDDTPKPLLNKPLVRQIFKSIVNASTTAKYVSVVHCNKSLFSLGIILIELLFWKTIEDMQSPEESSSKNLADSTADYLTAIRLIDSIYDDAGTSYGDAVRRCIKGLDLRETNLESDDFKNEVYSKVLYPLEENLKTFCNWKELPEIL